MTKRAVLYARVSSDDTRAEGRNLAGQIEMCRAYAAQHGYAVVAELSEDDKGASGFAFELPQLNRVRDMAQAGQFDTLIVREIDRLSRSLVKQLIVEEELRRAGVQIEYALASYDDTPEGRLNKHIKATISEYEREKVIERTVRGRRMHVENGSTIVHGHAPYGYRAVRGEHGWRLEVDAAEAKVVREIFNMVATEGLGVRAIAAKLDALGVPTPAETAPELHLTRRVGAGWAAATLYGILTNKTYIGSGFMASSTGARISPAY